MEAREFGFARVDDAAGAEQGRPGGNANLGEAVDHLFEGVAFGDGGADVDAGRCWGFDGRVENAEDEFPLAAGLAGVLDDAVGAVALACEEVEGVIYFETFDADSVMGFWSGNGEDLAGGGGGMGLEDAMWHGPGLGGWTYSEENPMVQQVYRERTLVSER